MTTITKERLLTIRQWRETYGPGSNVVLPAEEAEELARIALTSLEAEPVAYIFKHPAGKLFWALTDESNKEQADVIPVYAAAPASVVPDNASEPLAYAYKELTPEIMRNHLAVFERYGIAPNDSSTTIQALRIALDGIERSDAMLHGAEPVSQTYKFPVNTPCQDAPAHIWLQTAGVWPEDGELSELTWCSHNQHHDDTLYVRADLVNGNSPVTPAGWISCSERTPNDAQWCVVNTKYGYYVQCWSEGQGWLGDDISIPECDVINWMPLPEPPQEVNRG
ncbi:DUF551 domain-containing protein [Escherichia coli]|uniref:DUF551 domain-containing protein n=1 Tax=Escherichia coli TaxID=562 RepID=A0AAN3IJ73_ECOLX|nr:DUF551 domain-containing protein [Escherichia coli]EFJ9376984.1 DUF551 domain-containing protein [Escherichia coli]EFK0005086.1 DUF551 domain-containing protein [Escherichia coli]EFM0251407.1 DUF551 domain-containing protein [Escherichia coli]EHN0156870.1 DUF551 domain-containing protein [Escherichia coli]